MVFDLYIIAAGNGSRLKSSVPKALVPITEEPCLTTTLQQVAHKFRRVYVVCNVLVQEQWRDYFTTLQSIYPDLAEQTVGLAIHSGLGDGHATLQGILAAEGKEPTELSKDIVIAWGDVFIPQGEIIDELLAMPPKGSGLLPAVHEKTPYVTLLVDEDMSCKAADFSRQGEEHLDGFHDQSVFRFDLSRLKAALNALHNAFWKNGRYLAPAGELSLLYAFHLLYNTGNPAYVYTTKYPTRSFNTIQEVAAIQQEISRRWRSRAPSLMSTGRDLQSDQKLVAARNSDMDHVDQKQITILREWSKG